MRAVQVAGNVWAVSPAGTLCFKSPASSQWNSARRLSSPVVAITASESKATVYAGCDDGSLHIFDAISAAYLVTGPDRQHDRPLCMLPLPKEDALFVGLQDGSFARLHLGTLQFDCILGNGIEHKDSVNAVEADEQYIYSASEDAIILVWDPKEENAVREMSVASDPITSIIRVDANLWVGLRTGFVEVYDIFGDDTNGIECISSQKAHDGPVTDFLRVGNSEVWSVTSTVAQPGRAKPDNASIVRWDTRDFSHKSYDGVDRNDLMAITVVDRSAFEEVSVLALGFSLMEQVSTTNVRGTMPAPIEEEEDSMDELVSDLENKLVQANEEIHALRQAASQSPSSPPPITERLARMSVSSRVDEGTPHTNCKGKCEDQLCPARLEKEYYNFSGDDDDATDPDPLLISGPASEAIKASLNKLSGLLVSLLADDVLEPHQIDSTPSEDLRAAVANITKELNTSKTLIEKHTVTPSQGSKPDAHGGLVIDLSGDFSNLTPSTSRSIPGSTTARTSTGMQSTALQAREEDVANVEKLRGLEKDLQDVTKERDLLCNDLDMLRSETEATLTAFEGLLERKSSQIEEKDKLIAELRTQCKTFEKRFENERALRAELKRNLESQLDVLTRAAEATSNTFEEQLSAAYDRIETKSIEIQSQREVLRTSENKLEELKEANQRLESSYTTLEAHLQESIERTHNISHEFCSRAEVFEREHCAEIDALKKKHSETLATLQRRNEELDQSARGCENDLRNEKQKYFLEVQALKDERDRRVDNLNKARADFAERERNHLEKIAKLEINLQEMEGRFNSAKDKFERSLYECRHASEVAIQTINDTHKCELHGRDVLLNELRTRLSEAHTKHGDSSSLEQDLRKELQAMVEEKKLLLREVEHREAAEKHFQAEAENLQSAITDVRLANEELQDLLDEKERESVDFFEKVEQLNAELKSKERRLHDLEGMTGTVHEENDDGLDTDMATKAILASAAGETEQLTRQIDALNRTYISQERELNVLREAVSTRDEMLRRRNAFIDDLALEKVAVEASSPSGLSLNVSLEGLQVSTERNRASSPKSSRTTGTLSSVDVVEERQVCNALQEIQDGMSLTQGKLRDLTCTARRYKRFAQSHLDVLPALHELEGELVRISMADSRKGASLASARGIVQSLIAQHYTSGQKQALLKEFDENLYQPSSERLHALHAAIARLRKIRTGSEEVVSQRVDDVPNEVITAKPERPLKSTRDAVLSTRRLLTF